MAEEKDRALAIMPELSSAERQLIRNIYAKGASDLEFNSFLMICKYRELNPFAGQMFLIPFKDDGGKQRMIPVVSIHGLRSMSAKGGRYEGTTLPYFLDKEGKWHEAVWTKDEHPVACKIGIRMQGVDEPTWGVATWKQSAKYTKAGGLRGIWKTYPELMLAKCAEADGHRKANPLVMGGIYIAEEFGHEGIENLDHSPEAATPQNQHQAKAHAETQGKYSDNETVPFGKHKDQKWCDIPPEYLDWIMSNVKDKPDIVDRAQWEIDKRAGNLPELPPENGDIQDADFADDPAPMNEEDERKVLLASIRGQKDILGNDKFQELCSGIATEQKVKHLSDVDTPGLQKMESLLTEAVNEQLEGGADNE